MFDPRTELINNHAHNFNPTGHESDTYDGWGAMNFGARARTTAQNYENYRNFNGDGVQFRPQNMEDESGVSSPPLWKTSPPRSPLHPRQHQNNYRYLSPASRAQAIARGQWELMEMVKNMPESCYELSLKDLVEQPRVGAPQESLLGARNFGNGIVNQRVKIQRQESQKKEKKAKMMRSRTTENGGLFLKMVFPISFGSKKKNKNNSGTNTCAKVSPKPHEALDKCSRGVEKEWWKKRFSISGESTESSGSNSGSTGRSGSSGSSGSSSRSNSSRKRSGFLPGCWSSFFPKKSKSAK